jgi:hypothetical protein
MEINISITSQDIQTLKDLVKRQESNTLVKGRHKRNIADEPPDFSRDLFWQTLVGCLLSTQQRSDPETPVGKFTLIQPFPLAYQKCRISGNIQEEAQDILSSFGGIRFTARLPIFIAFNLTFLENGGWKTMEDDWNKLKAIRKEKPAIAFKLEREVCRNTQKLKGVGPKQSRNLWQDLGLLRYEIPLDSRFIKWLNGNGFPVKLTAAGLSDGNYYEFILDALQKWCLEADVLPCIFDAAVYSSLAKKEEAQK